MKKVICIGDSITQGVGSIEPSVFSYVAQLNVMLGKDYDVINCGRDGSTLMSAPNGIRSQYRLLTCFKLAIGSAKTAFDSGEETTVSIMLGTNDADTYDYGFTDDADEYFRIYHDEFIKEYFFLIDSILDVNPNAKFIICKSPYSYDGIKHKNFGNLKSVWSFQDEIVSLCENRKIKHILNDMAAATAPDIIDESKVSAYYKDRLHPNQVGHAYFAHFFCEAVKKAERL